MANEAILIFETESPIPFTCDNATGIAKGTQCILSDPMTAAASSAASSPVAGISAEEKIASDGKTKIAVYRGGIFKVTVSGSVTAGDGAATAEANLWIKAPTNEEDLGGTFLEDATALQTCLMELKPHGVSLA